MSGGVDSSVTALLLAKNVCQKKVQHIQTSSKHMLIVRISIFLLFLCGTGTLETNLAQTRDANGKEIGKMFNQFAENLIFLVNLCVLFSFQSCAVSLNFYFF